MDGTFMGKKKSNNILSIMLLLLAFCTSKYAWGYIAFYGICFFMFLRVGMKIRLMLLYRYFLWFVLPHIFIVIHAFLTILFYHQTFYISRSINNFLYAAMYILFSYCFYILHEKRAITIICQTILIYYTGLLLQALLNTDPLVFVKNIFIPGSEVLTRWLESHDIGLSVGMILLFYMFFYKKTVLRYIYVLALLTVFLLCWKRIALAAFFAALIYLFVLSNCVDKKGKMIWLWGIIGVIICFAYIYVIYDNKLIPWLLSHNINPMGRNTLYSFFSDYYTFSIVFPGRGSGFTGKLLTSLAGTGKGVGTVVAIHSDILRSYIEYGFIGSMLWYAYYLFFLPMRFRRIDSELGNLFFVIAFYSFIIYLTDNASSYMLFQMLYILLPLCYDPKPASTGAPNYINHPLIALRIENM